MDNSVFDFYDEGDKKENTEEDSRSASTSQLKRLNTGHYGFDYESAGESDSSTVTSVTPVTSACSYDMVCSLLASGDGVISCEDSSSTDDEASVYSKSPTFEAEFQSSVSKLSEEINNPTTFKDNQITNNEEICKKTSAGFCLPKGLHKSIKNEKMVDAKSHVKNRSAEVTCKEFKDSAKQPFSFTDTMLYSDDVEHTQTGMSSLTTTEKSRDSVPGTKCSLKSTNGSGIKYGSEYGKQEIDKMQPMRKIGGNLLKGRNQINHKPASDDKQTRVIQVTNATKNTVDKKFVVGIPIQLKAEAFYQNGELEVNVTTYNGINPVNKNLNVKLTIIHKYNKYRTENKRSQKKTKGKQHKLSGLKSDRNIVDSRANWPEFNTTLTEDANKRYLARLGI